MKPIKCVHCGKLVVYIRMWLGGRQRWFDHPVKKMVVIRDGMGEELMVWEPHQCVRK